MPDIPPPITAIRRRADDKVSNGMVGGTLFDRHILFTRKGGRWIKLKYEGASFCGHVVPDRRAVLAGPAMPLIDPLADHARKTSVWFKTDEIENADAPGGAQPYAVQIHRVMRSAHRSNLSGNGPQTDWTALVIRVRDHQDKAAFAALFRHFAPRVKGFLMKSGAGATLAEECAQDVMATLWQKAVQFDPARASVATWVYTIARNRRIDMLRKSLRAEPEDLDWGPDVEPDQADIYEAQQENLRLGKALALLPDAQRKLIERAYFGDLSHSEIAAETGLPLGTIKSRIRLALDRLRKDML